MQVQVGIVLIAGLLLVCYMAWSDNRKAARDDRLWADRNYYPELFLAAWEELHDPKIEAFMEATNYCPDCGCHYATHNDDGSCVEDDTEYYCDVCGWNKALHLPDCPVLRVEVEEV
jgi:predicted RNA-binding Zn-ribbon protein involved in translation (DUF1610 family)